ncbi:MAG: molecular chaperone GrpE [Solirubrobacteraceae bacterium]|jgi:molecular chaperone GrpE|nr:molecular chaperone GrpE [Solirubrobacteraceae bacterium]
MTDETTTQHEEEASGTAPEADAPAPEADAPAPESDAPAPEGEPAEAQAAVEQDLDALVVKARERDEYLGLAQRTQADFENYRKRMARENAAAADRGAGRLAKELLPALDHLDLALKASEGDEETVKGFAMVREEIVAALGRLGIEPFSPHGEPFDPNEHEAMVQQPAEGAEPGTILEVYQQGYRINGAVLRPARVVVAA